MVSVVDGAIRESEVVVIGAGLVGCSIAYQLAKRGKQVTVFDSRGVCSGASGRNGGLTGVGSPLHGAAGDAVYALATENFRMLESELAPELGSDFSLAVSGTLHIATTDAEAEHLQRSIERR